ncbi:hypothetical protein FA15DRAFT_759511 [Coprinopsis marcescibilis]|uniref:Uncharacterized protein n=1 Tax=Coprinopsis marcescibilis TaxID=230819 RepID=A0A5C3KJ97_COPMA|nr:hypothetical protein FA15DRAFT_759511 [Coprinopsis marcescibilis]
MESSPPHPIHTIPAELLAKIFKTATNSSLKEWHDTSTTVGWNPPFPMLACAVCRHWRDIALNSPDLWSTVHVPISVSERPPRSLRFDPAKLTSRWLDHSKSAPLDVYISIPSLMFAYDLCGEVILPKVTQHADRLRLLAITGDVKDVSSPNIRGILASIAQKMGSTWPTRTLSLRFIGSVDCNARITTNTALLDRFWDNSQEALTLESPAVQKLEIEGIRFNISWVPGLVSLTVYDLESTHEEFHQLFISVPHLRELSLHRLRVFLDSTGPKVNIIPNLEYLSLGFHRRPSTSEQSYPATTLRLPNLRTLKLDGTNGLPICTCLDLSFFTAINQLGTLQIANFDRFSMDAQSDTTLTDIQLLQSLTSIRSLEIINTPCDELLGLQTPGIGRTRRVKSIGSIRAPASAHLLETGRNLDLFMRRMRINGLQEVSSTSIRSSTVESGAPGPELSAPGSSGTSEDKNNTAQTTITWPNLDTISIDSISSSDIVSLCRYVAARSGQVKTVRLSGVAQRHLSKSVKRRTFDDTFYAPNFVTARKYEWEDKEGKEKVSTSDSHEVESAQEWMSSRVLILPFEHDHLSVALG